VRVHQRQAVEHPHHAVEQRRQVRHRGVLLHRLLLPDAVEGRPASMAAGGRASVSWRA
jgi:hypothetical protein